MGVEQMLKCLSNSFSRFIHIATFGVPNNLPCQKEYKDIAGSLKLFKRILDNIDDSQIHSDEILQKMFEELDVAVNEAREFIENWGFHSSKIYGVVESRQLIVKIQNYSIKICETVIRSLDSSSSSSSSPSTSTLADIQNCMEEFERVKLEIASEKVEESMKFIREGKVPPLEILTVIIDLLHLSSSQELLKETIAVEKETIRVDQSNQVNHVVDLISHIRETMVNLETSKTINGVSVSVPSYFICPLSLQLMFDPVIMSSGQTFDRDSIKKWLDYGFTRCPVTRQTLSHTNLIPNYTVKALITNWCDENNVKVNGRVDHEKVDYERKVENGFDHRSPVESCSHSRTGSTSTAVSSSDYQHVSISNSGEFNSDSGVFSHDNRSYPRTVSLPIDSSVDGVTTSSIIEQLVNELKSDSNSAQTKAASELRFLAKNNMENRTLIGQSGAIPPLLHLLKSNVKITQEHAVTALLNLSINGNIKSKIAESGAIEPLIYVLETGTPSARENAAATLFSLSLIEEYRVKIGQSGAVKPLVDLLRSGSLRGKKDAATALFNLSIFHENKARIIQAGAVKYLVELMEPESEMVDKSVALLSNLASVPEGCLAIAKEGGIPILVEVVETGTPRGKENSASILLQLCIGSPKYCRLVLQEGAVPPLVALSQSGTSRAKEKAQQLLSHFRSQRENGSGRGKS